MKKIIAIVALLAVLLIGGKVVFNIVDNNKQERFLLGEWEAVAQIAILDAEYITDGDITLSFDRKGNTFYQRGDRNTDYTWECTGYYSEYPAFKYGLKTADNRQLGEVFAISNKAFLLREVRVIDADEVEVATIFVKKGQTDKADSNTDFSQLLGFDPADLGFTYIEDDEACSLIEGSWYSIKMYEDGGTTYLAPSAASLDLADGKYEITLAGEFAAGSLDYNGFAKNMYMYNMDGEYEGLSLLYNEEDNSLILYEKETEIAVLFNKEK